MKWVLTVIGVLLALMGSVWFLQGINVLPGSVMSGQMLWTINGSIAAAIGIGLLLLRTGPKENPAAQMTLAAIHHVQITIPRGAEAEARAFYCGVLGLAEVAKPDSLQGRGGFWLQVGAAQVHVGVEDAYLEDASQDGFDRRRSKAHVAYEAAGLDHWRTKLEQHGVAVVDSVPIPNHARFEFLDPFGNRVELIEKAA